MKYVPNASLVLILVAALVGCAESAQPNTQDTEPITATITTTVSAAPETAGSQTSQPTTLLDDDCQRSVYTSDFAQHINAGKVMLGELGAQPWEVDPIPDSFFHFQIKEDGYNACLPLSFVSLAGSNGDAERSAGTGSSINEAVVFFHYGSIINNPAPFEMKTIESAQQISDSEVEIRYGHAGRSTAEGVTETFTLRFYYDPGLSAIGNLPDSIDNHARLYL